MKLLKLNIISYFLTLFMLLGNPHINAMENDEDHQAINPKPKQAEILPQVDILPNDCLGIIFKSASEEPTTSFGSALANYRNLLTITAVSHTFRLLALTQLPDAKITFINALSTYSGTSIDSNRDQLVRLLYPLMHKAYNNGDIEQLQKCKNIWNVLGLHPSTFGREFSRLNIPDIDGDINNPWKQVFQMAQVRSLEIRNGQRQRQKYEDFTVAMRVAYVSRGGEWGPLVARVVFGLNALGDFFLAYPDLNFTHLRDIQKNTIAPGAIHLYSLGFKVHDKIKDLLYPVVQMALNYGDLKQLKTCKEICDMFSFAPHEFGREFSRLDVDGDISHPWHQLFQRAEAVLQQSREEDRVRQEYESFSLAMHNAYETKDGHKWDQLAAQRAFNLNDLGGVFITFPFLTYWKEIQDYEAGLRIPTDTDRAG